jgi:tetratricopeptide (TPR) repeat protein
LHKFFYHLKKYFYKTKNETKEDTSVNEAIDLNLEIVEKKQWILENVDFRDESYVKEVRQILKFSTFSFQQHYDLAISFIQIEMPLVALVIIEKVLEENLEQELKLKVLYLKSNCLFELKDFRKVVDVCHDAISLSRDDKEAMSFLYNQAEALAQLGELKEAKKNLLRIISIDETYRMTKDRLRTLDEY